MIVTFSPSFLATVKKTNVRIRKSLKVKIAIFSKDPYSPQLNNHSLREEYQGYRSIDITNDYRAIYRETMVRNETVAYFIAFGRHKELYKK